MPVSFMVEPPGHPHFIAFVVLSRVNWFQGNHADYEADRRRRLGDEADQPHRIKYKPLRRD